MTTARMALGAGVRVHRATIADVVLARRDNAMQPRWFTDRSGVEHVVVLDARNAVRLMNAMVTLFAGPAR